MAPHVEAILNFHRPRPEGAPRVLLDQDDMSRTNLELEPQNVRIHDARGNGAATLATSGFELVKHATTVRDFQDRDEVREVYFPEVVALMKDLAGARDVLIFGEVLRSNDDGIRDQTKVVPADEKRDRTRQGVSASAHVDYDRASTEAYVADIVGEAEAAKLLKRRFQLINLWRGVAPVERSPLAVCDGRTVAPRDLVPWEIRRPVGPKLVHARSGYQIAFNPDQRWSYFPRMVPDELLLFTLCDSEPSAVQRVAHTAFDDPTTPDDAPPRTSFELRTICFF